MRLEHNTSLSPLNLTSVKGESVVIPHPQQWTHIQFRRFAGCPICNLHLQQFITRHAELEFEQVQEVAVFHSSVSDMLPHQLSAPFAYIADPTKVLYQQFGVEQGLSAILHPSTWLAAATGMFKHGVQLPSQGEGNLGLPADFLIAPDGRILACKYGTHANDQWSVDEVLQLVKSSEFCNIKNQT